MPSARDLLAAEERYEALSDAQKRAVINVKPRCVDGRSDTNRARVRARIHRQGRRVGAIFFFPRSRSWRRIARISAVRWRVAPGI